jgi:NADH-quinone oxidoreductase subunit H
MDALFSYLVFPGFLFTAGIGCIASWLDRKVTARVQWRVGPPFFQPVFDLVKLMVKETVIPRGCAKGVFLGAPLFGLATVTLVSTLIWKILLDAETAFAGDLIVILYLLMIPGLSVIVGGFSSRNPIASLGASREMKLMLADELPFILAASVPIIQAKGSISLGFILGYQETYGMILGTWSGALAFIAAILAMQAKLALVPFDMAEAETEIMGGVMVEYSGPPLAVFKLTRIMMLFTLPMLLVALFMGGVRFDGLGALWSVLKYILLLVLVILIRNTNPRLRIDQAMRFLWGPVTWIAVLAVVVAILGH